MQTNPPDPESVAAEMSPEVRTELERIFCETNSFDPKAVIRGHNPRAALAALERTTDAG